MDDELVTLAACMTGVGQVMQGEGVLNFARAFQQPDLAASLFLVEYPVGFIRL